MRYQIKFSVSILILVVVSILSISTCFAFGENYQEQYLKLRTYHIVTPHNEYISESNFEDMLKCFYDEGWPIYNGRADRINPFVKADYNFTVYGYPHGGFYPSEDGKFQKNGIPGEYQYLGYDYTGVSIPNDKYHNPYSRISYFNSADDYINKIWVKTVGAYHTWLYLNQQELHYVKNYPFVDDDYTGDGTPPTLGEIFKDDELFSYCVLLYKPRFFDWGMVSTRYYKSNGNTDYNTLLLKPMQVNMYPDMEFIVSLNTDKDTFNVSSSETELNVDLNITAIINNLDLKHIREISYSVNDQTVKQDISVETNEYRTDLETTIDCSNLVKGENIITLESLIKIIALDYSEHSVKVSKTIIVMIE